VGPISFLKIKLGEEHLIPPNIFMKKKTLNNTSSDFPKISIVKMVEK
jgi:hypothetical protein